MLVAEAGAAKAEAGLARPPAWPNAAFGAVDPPVAQGEARFPSPKVGVLVVPNDGLPNEGAPKAGLGAAVDGVELNAPNALVEDAVAVGVPQGDWLFPRADGPPKAPPVDPGREGAPNALAAVLPKAGAVLRKAGAPNAGLLGAGAGDAGVDGKAPAATTRPGYIVPCRIDSE